MNINKLNNNEIDEEELRRLYPTMVYSPETFFICDRKKDCNKSKICGEECKYTRDPKHALKGTLPIRRNASPEIYRR